MKYRPTTQSSLNALVAAISLTAALASTPLAADPHVEGDLTSYTYVEAFEGRGRVEHAWSDDSDALELHYPLSTGDRVTLDPGAQLALILPDRTRVRLSGPSDFVLLRVALAREDRSTVTEIELREGEIQVVVDEDFLADELPIVTTPAGSIFLHEPGNYVIYSEYDWSTVTARTGFAELSTERGSAIVRAGETLTVEGGEWPRLSTHVAGSESPLEIWSSRLDEERIAYGSGYVDRSLWHSSAPLERHGSWVQVSGRHAWSPRVSSSWRPYYDGRWVPTRSGYTWVTSEPWGWVTYHYGTWDYSPGYGWVWYPGRVYSPAWVYWHWSDSYVGWVPTGYYSSYYGGLHLGVHGWATASWSTYSNWNFCRTRDVGRRDSRAYVTSGYELGRTARSRQVPRGLVTTDTRPDDPRVLSSPEDLPERLARRRGAGPEELPDVSGFVGRNDVPTELANKIRTRVPMPRTEGAGETGERTLTNRAPVLRAAPPSRVDSRGRIVAAPQVGTARGPESSSGQSRPVAGTVGGASGARSRGIPNRRVPTATAPQRTAPREGAQSRVVPRRTSPGSPSPTEAAPTPPSAGVPRAAPQSRRAPAPEPSAPAARRFGPQDRSVAPGDSPSRGMTNGATPGAAAPPKPSTSRRVLERIRSYRKPAPTVPPPSQPSSGASSTESSRREAPPSRAEPSRGSSSSRSSRSSSDDSSARSSSSESSSARSGGSASNSRSSSARRSRPPKKSESDGD